jgi:tetratricopeptide (TPR) repeat protein
MFSSTWNRTACCRRAIEIFFLSSVLLFAAGCGNLNERRTIWKTNKILGQKTKEIDELQEVRGKLKRIIHSKIQAVELLETADRVLARKYMNIESYNLAEEVLKEAEYLKPNSAFIKKELGECYYFLAQSAVSQEEDEKYFSLSRQYYEASLSLDPDLQSARYGFGLLLFFGFNDVSGAIEEMKKILEEEPGNVDAHFALGRFYYEANELGKSLGEYIAITRILPPGSERRKKAEQNILRINSELGIEVD